jgi:hypothetical protein
VLGYYQSLFYNIKTKYTRAQFKLDRAWQEKYLYYKNEFNIVLNNAEIKQFIEKDSEYIDLKEKLVSYQNILERIEDMLKGLDSMKWTIKSLIDWEKFKAGEY